MEKSHAMSFEVSDKRKQPDLNQHLHFLQLLFFYISSSVLQQVGLSLHSERDHFSLVFESSHPCFHALWFSDQRHVKSLGLETKLPVWKRLRRMLVFSVQDEHF